MEPTLHIPPDLTAIVRREDIRVLGYGQVLENHDGASYVLYRQTELSHLIPLFEVDKDFLDRRNLKPGDSVAYVSYPYANGRTVFDVFSLKR